MPVTDGFVAYVLEQLEAVGDVSSKRMFGGVGLYAGDRFFALLDDDVLYLKADDSNRADFEAAGARPFQPYGPGSESTQYYEVPVGVLEDAAELARWAGKSIAVAAAKRAKKTKPRRHKGTKKSKKKTSS